MNHLKHLKLFELQNIWNIWNNWIIRIIWSICNFWLSWNKLKLFKSFDFLNNEVQCRCICLVIRSSSRFRHRRLSADDEFDDRRSSRRVRRVELSGQRLSSKLRLATFRQIVRTDLQSVGQRSCFQAQQVFHWKRKVTITNWVLLIHKPSIKSWG